MSNDLAHVIKTACEFISNSDFSGAAQSIITEYPFSPQTNQGRSYGPRFMTQIFVRDGFIDRYRGTRLVFPPVLRLLSHYLPGDFPYHKNAKMDESHSAYWELLPTIDHVFPVARGGPDTEANCVCCSMLTNSIKSNWTLEQLQWQLRPAGDVSEWDGMTGWFLEHVRQYPSLLQESPASPYLKRWLGPAKEFVPHRNEPTQIV